MLLQASGLDRSNAAAGRQLQPANYATRPKFQPVTAAPQRQGAKAQLSSDGLTMTAWTITATFPQSASAQSWQGITGCWWREAAHAEVDLGVLVPPAQGLADVDQGLALPAAAPAQRDVPAHHLGRHIPVVHALPVLGATPQDLRPPDLSGEQFNDTVMEVCDTVTCGWEGQGRSLQDCHAAGMPRRGCFRQHSQNSCPKVTFMPGMRWQA